MGGETPLHFCGLNGSRLLFRSKTPRRVVEELRSLASRHQVQRACAADNIFDHRYHAALLPRLKEANLGLRLMFEMRTAMSRARSRRSLPWESLDSSLASRPSAPRF